MTEQGEAMWYEAALKAQKNWAIANVRRFEHPIIERRERDRQLMELISDAFHAGYQLAQSISEKKGVMDVT